MLSSVSTYHDPLDLSLQETKPSERGGENYSYSCSSCFTPPSAISIRQLPLTSAMKLSLFHQLSKPIQNLFIPLLPLANIVKNLFILILQEAQLLLRKGQLVPNKHAEHGYLCTMMDTNYIMTWQFGSSCLPQISKIQLQN